MHENSIAIRYIETESYRQFNVTGQRSESKMFYCRICEGKVYTSEYITEELDAVVPHVRICVGSVWQQAALPLLF